LISNKTVWHTKQLRRIAALLDIVQEYPAPLRGLIGARLISLTDAIEHLHGKPRSGSNHDVVDKMITDLETVVAVKDDTNV
jgi:hypothetical protein